MTSQALTPVAQQVTTESDVSQLTNLASGLEKCLTQLRDNTNAAPVVRCSEAKRLLEDLKLGLGRLEIEHSYIAPKKKHTTASGEWNDVKKELKHLRNNIGSIIALLDGDMIRDPEATLSQAVLLGFVEFWLNGVRTLKAAEVMYNACLAGDEKLHGIKMRRQELYTARADMANTIMTGIGQLIPDLSML